ncbi:MAG: TetR/AcrR family transcriptional regulator [Gammaproteobacteria bacterium]|nr:TetR/AcrR family transcriptional regulator [Gammaproteobacteria bacterium]
MATRGRPKSDQKRQQILDAAGELFALQGYEGTSLDALAAAAGVSKQTIYSHFESKADVLREGVARRCRSGLLTAEHLDFDLPPQRFLPEFAQRFINVLLDDTALSIYRLCLSESKRHPEVGISFYESGPKVVMAAMSEYLRLATERGELHVDHPEIAAAQFLFMVKGKPVDSALLGVADWPEGSTHEEYTRGCCEMFLRAYSAS